MEERPPGTKSSLFSGLAECPDTRRSCVQSLLPAGKGRREPRIPPVQGEGAIWSFTYPPFGFHLNDAGTHLSASKIGDIPIVLHRPIEGNIKTLTIHRTATGKWYACFSVEYDPTPVPQKGTVVGVDVGLESFATLSNGEKIENPRFFRTDEKALAKAQRKLSITEKETPERKKARKVVARIHERIANRRLDFAHQTSRMMVDRFGTIVFENLKITNMQKKHCRCGLESVHHDHREQSGRGWFSCDPGESQKYITAVFPMWYDRR
ncbi:MAG: transposase [Candidatus Methanoculleus thermohydrogenotrophicum]